MFRRKLAMILTVMMVTTIFFGINCFPVQAITASTSYPSVIGWESDINAGIAYKEGSFLSRVKNVKGTTYGFGIYNSPTTMQWYNESGYLPCLVTQFDRDNCTVKIENFGDKVTIGGNAFVLVYSRVSVYNHDTVSHTESPAPSSSDLVALTSPSTTIPAGQTVNFDYVIAIDKFGASYSYPTSAQLIAAGSWDLHFTDMSNYWNSRLAGIVSINQLPDTSLINAYKAGYIYTQIIKDGNNLNVGENGYDGVYDHDAIGIMSTLLILGDYTNAQTLLTNLRAQIQYDDAIWKYSWPWALYLWKTGDTTFVNNNFTAIQTYAHQIQTDRTGPGGIIKMTNDIDSNGYWTCDNYSALTGLICYKYICQKLGNTTEATWADSQYTDLLNCMNTQLNTTITTYGLNYIPCSMVQPNTSNRCNNPQDANWASAVCPWIGTLFNGAHTGVMHTMIDATYDYGFGRLVGILPAHDFGGFPTCMYSSGYNAMYALGGLDSSNHRSEGIYAYQFMINNTQCGPFSWWEATSNPTTTNWVGTHPAGGQGSCPHMWGQSGATEALLESLIAEKVDGTVIVGNGVPNAWVASGQVIDLTNYAITNNNRMGIKIEGLTNTTVKLTLSGSVPTNNVVFDLPIFKNNISSTTSGTIDNTAGTVTIAPTTTTVTVTLIQ